MGGEGGGWVGVTIGRNVGDMTAIGQRLVTNEARLARLHDALSAVRDDWGPFQVGAAGWVRRRVGGRVERRRREGRWEGGWEESGRGRGRQAQG